MILCIWLRDACGAVFEIDSRHAVKNFHRRRVELELQAATKASQTAPSLFSWTTDKIADGGRALWLQPALGLLVAVHQSI